MCTDMYVCTCIQLHEHVYAYVGMYVCMHVCMYVCMAHVRCSLLPQSSSLINTSFKYKLMGFLIHVFQYTVRI